MWHVCCLAPRGLEISILSGTKQQRHGQCHIYSCCSWLNTDLCPYDCVVVVSSGVIGPLAVGHGHLVTTQATEPSVSSIASGNAKQHGRLFDGWAEPSNDWQTVDIQQADLRVPVPDICVSAYSEMIRGCGSIVIMWLIDGVVALMMVD